MVSRTEYVGNGQALTGLNSLNVIVGRNGSGKSRFLRDLMQAMRVDQYFVRYLSPERGGAFRKHGDLDNSMAVNKHWLNDNRNQNQVSNFKAASAYLLREVEVLYLRRLQADPILRADTSHNFSVDRLDRVNRLLSNISVEQSEADFIFRSMGGQELTPEQISSGESEIISLASEVLHFFEMAKASLFNVLLIDEPDVHIHPDMQARFARFLINEINDLAEPIKENTIVCIATHSAPLVCAMASSPLSSIGTKQYGISEVRLQPTSNQLRKLAPLFGHPLSQTISDDVPMIIEGEDDERVWQQAARTAQGKLKIFPILALSVDMQGELEKHCSQILEAIYDEPEAISIRDGDGILESLDPIGPVKRFRLRCYAAENLLLTDECLAVLETTGRNLEKGPINGLRSIRSIEMSAVSKRFAVHPTGYDTTKLRQLEH